MSDRTADNIGVVFCLLVSAIIGASFCDSIQRDLWEAAAVKHHAAHYDSQTGKWQWNDDKPEKQP